jgi:hypothetical protein
MQVHSVKSFCSRVSTEVVFCNPSEVRIFSELVYTSSESTELNVQNSAEFRAKKLHRILQKTLLLRNYCNSEKVAVLCLQWTRKKSMDEDMETCL